MESMFYCDPGNAFDLPRLSPAETVRTVAEYYRAQLAQDKWVLLLGGEQTVSVGVFLACKENEPEITKVHINVSFNRLRFYSYGWTIVKTTTFGVPLVQVGIRDSFQKSWRRPPQYAVIDAIKTEKVYLALSAKQEGLDGWYANCLLKKIFQCKTVIGADITEIKRCDIPRAAKLCATMLAGHAARRA